MMHRSDIDPKLLANCLANDRLGQRELYEQFYGYAFNICIRYARNKVEAGEMLNDGFLRVFSGIQSYRKESPFRPWFKRVMINSCLNYLRKHHTLLVSLNEINEPEMREVSTSDLQYQDILQAVQSLPPMYRSVFNLYEIEGHSHQEISQLLGISVVTSRSNLMRAKTKLKAMLSDYAVKGKIKYQL